MSVTDERTATMAIGNATDGCLPPKNQGLEVIKLSSGHYYYNTESDISDLLSMLTVVKLDYDQLMKTAIG